MPKQLETAKRMLDALTIAAQAGVVCFALCSELRADAGNAELWGGKAAPDTVVAAVRNVAE
jgi:hypothetical protein